MRRPCRSLRLLVASRTPCYTGINGLGSKVWRLRGAALRIGIDASRAVIGEKTGTETYSYHLIRELLRLDSPHDYALYFNQPPPSGTFPGAPKVTERVMPFP